MSKIRIIKLSEQKSAEKFETCLVCGANTNEDDSIARIKFEGSSITLCEHHMIELHDVITDFINWNLN